MSGIYPFARAGQQLVTDTDWSDEIRNSIEIGLLGIVRKIITLMPDVMVRRVVGYVVQHEALIALAHNSSIVFRTAVVRVSVRTLICVHRSLVRIIESVFPPAKIWMGILRVGLVPTSKIFGSTPIPLQRKTSTEGKGGG